MNNACALLSWFCSAVLLIVGQAQTSLRNQLEQAQMASSSLRSDNMNMVEKLRFVQQYQQHQQQSSPGDLEWGRRSPSYDPDSTESKYGAMLDEKENPFTVFAKKVCDVSRGSEKFLLFLESFLSTATTTTASTSFLVRAIGDESSFLVFESALFSRMHCPLHDCIAYFGLHCAVHT